MTEEERVQKAREWRKANIERIEYASRALAADDAGETNIPPMMYEAHHRAVDNCRDIVHVIDALFPELATS